MTRSRIASAPESSDSLSALGKARASIAILLAASCMGCILIAPADTSVSGQCSFRGRETDCGACLASRCGAQINAACGDDAVLTPMEQCAADGTSACGRLPANDVTGCLTARCAAVCYEKLGQSQTSCTDSFLGPGLACSCQVSRTPNDLLCSPTTYSRTRCCAPTSWPGPALSCDCQAVACVSTSDGCICNLADNLDAMTAEECRGTHCCAVEDRCQCRERACDGGEREVSVCNKAALVCPQGRMEVPSCSIRQ